MKSQIEIYNDHHLASPPTHNASTSSSRVDFWSDLKRGTRVNNIKLLAHARMMNRRTGNIYQIAESARLSKREFHSISQFGLIRAILSRYCRQKWASKCGSERTSAFFLFFLENSTRNLSSASSWKTPTILVPIGNRNLHKWASPHSPRLNSDFQRQISLFFDIHIETKNFPTKSTNEHFYDWNFRNFISSSLPPTISASAVISNLNNFFSSTFCADSRGSI